MSLSMQMTRGALGLSLLLLLGLLMALTKEPTRGHAEAQAVIVNVALCEMPPPRAAGWRLAQTPADLGPLARRWENCRA